MFTQNLFYVFVLCLQGQWWTDSRLPFSLVLFHLHIAQVLRLAILSEFFRGKYVFVRLIVNSLTEKQEQICGLASSLLIYKLRNSGTHIFLWILDKITFFSNAKRTYTIPYMGLLKIRVIYVLSQLRPPPPPKPFTYMQC